MGSIASVKQQLQAHDLDGPGALLDVHGELAKASGNALFVRTEVAKASVRKSCGGSTSSPNLVGMNDRGPTHSDLLRKLIDAGSEDLLESHDPDSHRKVFDNLAWSIDQALGSDQVLYCTHSLINRDPMNMQLVGTAIAFTSSLVATAHVRSLPNPSVQVTPLSSLAVINIDENRDAAFSGSAWAGRRISLGFDGPRNTLVFPAKSSSETNAREFAEFYPTLLDALQTR